MGTPSESLGTPPWCQTLPLLSDSHVGCVCHSHGPVGAGPGFVPARLSRHRHTNPREGEGCAVLLLHFRVVPVVCQGDSRPVVINSQTQHVCPLGRQGEAARPPPAQGDRSRAET